MTFTVKKNSGIIWKIATVNILSKRKKFVSSTICLDSVFWKIFGICRILGWAHFSVTSIGWYILFKRISLCKLVLKKKIILFVYLDIWIVCTSENVYQPLRKRKKGRKTLCSRSQTSFASVFLGLVGQMPFVLSHLDRFNLKWKASSHFISITENPYRYQFSYTYGTTLLTGTIRMQNSF